MKTQICALLSLSLFALPVSADSVEDLDKWFRDGYAALYIANAWDRADEFEQYFAEEIEYRSDNGLIKMDVNSFAVDSLEVWRSEGWLGTDVEALDTRLLNTMTAVFNVKWRDRNDDGSSSYECGYYLADKTGDQWRLSQYIATECKD